MKKNDKKEKPMKLYYSPGACSLSPHIVANELGLNVQLVKVNLANHTLDNGKNFFEINPKGYVPVLEIKEGEILTEGPAIVQFMGDQKIEAGIVPKAATLERYHLQEMLGYINSELHKTYSILFNPKIKPEVAEERKEYLKKRYTYLNDVLKDRKFLMGDHFTAVDAYLFTVTNWAPRVNLDLSVFPNVLNFQKRVGDRPAVLKALKEEGLIQ